MGWGSGEGSLCGVVVSGRGLGRVGDGWGSHWGCLRVKSGRVGLGSVSSRGRVGIVWGLSPNPSPIRLGCRLDTRHQPNRGWVGVLLGSILREVGWGRVGSGSSRGRVGAVSLVLHCPCNINKSTKRTLTVAVFGKSCEACSVGSDYLTGYPWHARCSWLNACKS